MLEDLKPGSFTPPCKVRELAETLEEKDAEILMQAVADEETWGAISLRNALQKRGLQISDKPIQRHREGRCPC